MNFVDLIIILVLLFYAIEGASSGFFNALLDLISFVISFAAGLAFYSFFGKFLSTNFSIPTGFSNAIGFFIASFVFEVLASFLLREVSSSLSLEGKKSRLTGSIDSLLGAGASVLSGILLASFILTMAVTLPLSPFVKKAVSSSKIAKVLTSNTQGLAKSINSVFGGAVNETLSFLTVEPKGNETVSLNFKTSETRPDPVAEKEMFDMVNSQRGANGAPSLSLGSQTLINVARAHCEDMFHRGYFSHYTPEGLSPFDRMQNGGVSFNAAGENLALAPNVDLAMQGLMQSPGHRANILSTDFGRVGVGVIDGGVYGEMFCQEFTN